MKNLMRVLSILVAIAGIILIITSIADPKYGDDLYKFALKVTLIFTTNILPIISIAACAYCLERNDTNYLVRIIPIYMTIPILVSVIMIVFETDAQWLYDFYQFLTKTFTGVTVLSLILIVKPNNSITKTLSFIAFGILATNVLLEIIVQVKSSLVDTLPNVYGYQNYGGFNFSTVAETNEFAQKMYSVTSIAQIFVIILLYMTNYAFSDKIELETDNIDYEAVKQDALNAANTQMNNIYNSSSKQKEPIQNTQNNNGLMNINNQLGQDSNVGTVKEQAKTMNIEGSSLDSLMPMSSGPVINNNNQPQQEQNVQEQQIQQEAPQQNQEPVPTPVPQNVDIQEEMKQRMQQLNQQSNINQNIPNPFMQNQDINNQNIPNQNIPNQNINNQSIPNQNINQ